jgi:hypothetical protein
MGGIVFMVLDYRLPEYSEEGEKVTLTDAGIICIQS